MQIVFRPRFKPRFRPSLDETRGSASVARQRENLAVWESIFADVIRDDDREEADYEDWHENAARLTAAVKSGHPVYALGRSAAVQVVGSANSNRSFDPDAPFVFVGSYGHPDPVCDLKGMVWPLGNANGVNAYHTFPSFHRFAGRPFAAASVPELEDGTKPSNPYLSVIRSMHAAGVRRFFIKLNLPKRYNPEFFTFDHDVTDAEIEREIFARFNWALYDISLRPDGLQIQAAIDMHHEYRVVVVDGKAVSGTGCIESHTPNERVDGIDNFDPFIEFDRNSRRIKRDEYTVGKYQEFVDRFLSDMRATPGMPLHYTLDLATNNDGEPIVIEMNPLLNYGLYANNYEAILDAMIRSAT